MARGWTLIELLVAVAVAAVIIGLASAIVGTAGRVTGVGLAASDRLAEIAAIEQRIRADFERLSPEGYFAVRCVAVPNDVNAPGPLLDASLPPQAVIRADQLILFVQGAQSIQTFRGGAGDNRRGQGSAARVYYGHAFQAPAAPGVVPGDENGDGSADLVWAADPIIAADAPIVPWFAGPRTFARTRFQNNATAAPGDYLADGVIGRIDATQPPARRWLLGRQAVAFADDGGSPAVFFFRLNRGGFRSTARIDDPAIRNGRVDAAAERLDDIRRRLLGAGGGTVAPWPDQRAAIAESLFYFRAERASPSMHRVDQALTAHVLAGACSSFVVDWTYADGTGEAGSYRGVSIDPAAEQPWFGLDAWGDPAAGRGVTTFAGMVAAQPPSRRPETILPPDIERLDPPGTPAGDAIQQVGAAVYEAIFGYNRAEPLDPATGAPWAADPGSPVAYTPWPSAVRITMTLHDPRRTRERGRVVQFVVELPGR